MTVCIDSIKRAVIWAQTHIIKKSYEVIFPLIANDDAALPIVLIEPICRRVAAQTHMQPCLIFRAARFAMLTIYFACYFTFQAAAATCLSGFELVRIYLRLASARALTAPFDASGSLDALKRYKASISLTGQIAYFAHVANNSIKGCY